MAVFDLLIEIVRDMGNIVSYLTWLFYIAALLFVLRLFLDLWQYRQQVAARGMTTWTLLEMRVPRQITKGPKAMEQFFYNFTTIADQSPQGHSFEIVGGSGTTRLFIRVPSRIALAVTSMLYGVYSDIEISQSEDYIYSLPGSYHQLRDIGYEMWGNEFMLDKEPVKPVRAYEDFEDKAGEERIIDPIAVILEVIGNLKPDESLWLQFIVAPPSPDWKEKGYGLIKQMKEKSQPTPDGKGGNRTPGEEFQIKRIEEKMSKPVFKTIIRYVYVGPSAIFNKDFADMSVYSALNQIASDINSFKRNKLVSPKVDDIFFAARKVMDRKAKLYEEYRNRFLEETTFFGKLDSSTFFRRNFNHLYSLLSSAELATLFHPPTNVVLTSVTMNRLESKRLPPPANLPS